MDYQQNLYHYYKSFPPARDRVAAVRWVKEWIPQELSSAGGKCSLYRWVREDMVQALTEIERERELEAAPKPEPTTEILFLCSYEGCGKTFTDVAALRKHSNIHGERQNVCNYPGCGKKFADSSKLKRHFLIHTGERDFVCPYEGCGKAFSLDFNLRAHMKTHLAENYHVCPYPECRKRYTNELKLTAHIKGYHEKGITIEAVKHTPPAKKRHLVENYHVCPYPECRKQYTDELKLTAHIKGYHEKSITIEAVKHTPPAEKPHITASKPLMTTSKTPTSSVVYVGPVTPARPYKCPYEGCDKAYIHEYKLNLHLKKEHPDQTNEQMDSYNQFNATNGSSKRLATPSPVNPLTLGEGKTKVKNKPNMTAQKAPAKVNVNQKISEFRSAPGTSLGGGKQLRTGKKMYEEEEEEEEDEEEDSEGTEDAEGNGEVGWGYGESRNGDDEDTEDED